MSEQNQGYRLSPQQKGLWLLHQGKPVVDAQCSIQLHGNVRAELLKEAVEKLVERHEILRTTFRQTPSTQVPLQFINASLTASWNEIDLSARRALDQEEEIAELCRQERRHVYDPEQDSPLRALLLVLSARRYLLIISLPTLCADNWTFNNLAQEIGRLYVARCHSQSLSDSVVQYKQFGEWQHELWESEPAIAGRAYWSQQNLTAGPTLRLPFEEQAPPGSEFEAGSLKLAIGPALSQRIGSLAREYEVTLSLLLLACWHTLLWKVTDAREVRGYLVRDGREHEELQGACGLFARALPIDCRLEGDVSLHQILLRLQQSVVEASEWEDYCIATDLIKPTEGADGTDPYPFAFEFLDCPPPYHGASLTFALTAQDCCLGPFSIKLSCFRRADNLDLEFCFDSRRHRAEDIRRLARHFELLLGSIVDCWNAPIASLRILDQEMEHQLLVEFNNTAADFAADRCVHHLFEAQVERSTDRPALITENGSLTYAQLNCQVNQLAHYLQTLGVGPEIPVAICVERSPEMMVSLLAVLKAGGAFLPLDAAYPERRLGFIIKQAGARLVLTSKSLAGRFVGQGLKLVQVDADWSMIARELSSNPISDVQAANLCYVLYTSGSTGQPKGVMVPHSGLVNYLQSCLRTYEVEAGKAVPVHSSIGFDLTLTSLFAPLLIGKAVLLVSEEKKSEGLAAVMRQDNDFSFIKLTPAHLDLLSQQSTPDQAQSEVRLLIVGGDALRYESLAYWRRRSRSIRIVNEYGPTETVVGCCAFEVPTGLDCKSGPVPIGRPIPNSQLYVLDKYLKPTPLGVPGELYVGGAGLARGYLRRPDLTAERFVPHAYSQEAGARLYRTGDVGRMLADGNLEYIGRVDHQVKVRGYRIELGEVEAVLREHASVEQAVVIVREGEQGERGLVGYVVVKKGSGVGKAELKRHLRAQLPEYMVPGKMELVAKLPLTANGKLDRKALSETAAGSQAEQVTDPEGTLVQELLREIWSDILGVESISLQDNFLDLGGHSLVALKLLRRVQETFHVEIELPDLFNEPTVAGLANCIERSLRNDLGEEAPPPVTRISREDELPLSFAQQRLWFLDQMAPGNTAYNVPTAVRFRGPLDVPALEWAINEIKRRHEVLRTNFRSVNGRALQVIKPAKAETLPLIDLSGIERHEREAESQRLVEVEQQRPFDLANGSLMRLSLFRMGAEEHLALLVLHHIITDAWSMGVLIRELTELYRSFAVAAPNLPELPLQYADYAAWQREHWRGKALEKHLGYWKRQLADQSSNLELPVDRVRPAVQTMRDGIHTFALSKELSHSLKTLSRQNNATLFMGLVAAFFTLLHRYTGQDDISVGTPVAGRQQAASEALIGFFVNTLVLRSDLSGNPSFLQLLRHVREICLEAYSHQEAPFEKVVEELRPERDLSRSPLFQVFFIMQNAPVEALELPDLTVEVAPTGIGLARFDLTLEMAESATSLRGILHYNMDLFESETIKGMAGHFVKLLEGIVAAPETPVADLPLLTKAERQELLVEWNDTQRAYPKERCVHELFETVAEQMPDAIAVTHEERTVSYGELNQRASQLACALRRAGVGPEVFVGICMSRSLEWVVGLLGILKAGGAYVSLDPTYPPDRLAFMMQDIRVPILLTQQSLLPALPEHGAQVICLDLEWENFNAEDDRDYPNSASAENSAYLVFTSGSTGRPKAIVTKHGSLLNLVYWHQRTFQITPADRASQVARMGFDASVWEVWPYLAAGASVHLVPDETRDWPPTLRDWLVAKRITIGFLPPVLAEKLLGEEWPASASLRVLLTGSDKAALYPPESLPFKYFNVYGPTEATVIVTFAEIPPSKAEIPPVIGRPLDNTQIYLLDRYLQPVPVRVAGELYIGGNNLALGYWNRPALTAEKFIPNPFSSVPGSRLYMTGDLARYLPDGNIEFIGRRDHQVKLRGFRIELGEIESALYQHPLISSAIVLLREDEPGAKRLVGYVTLHSDGGPTTNELREFLEQRLPAYMIPAAFVTLNEFPLTPNGKIDRRALPLPDGSRGAIGDPYTPPRNQVEEVLTVIWAQALGLNRVGIGDNFFELGGDSILCIQIVARANQEGLKLTPRQIFQFQTISELASNLELAASSDYADQGLVEGPMPLLPMQRWFFEEFDSDPQSLTQGLFLELRGVVDSSRLRKAVLKLVEHHDALRLEFQKVDSEWRAKISGGQKPDIFSELDVSELATSERLAAIASAATHWRTSLKLSTGSLIRVGLVNRGRDEPNLLLIFVHHLAVDGVSWRILLEDLERGYLQLSRGEEVKLPAKTASVKQWAELLQQYSESDQLRAELDYWLDVGRFGGLDLAPDQPDHRSAHQPTQGVSVNLSVEETRALLQQVPALYHTQINDLLLTALTLAFANFTGQRSLLVNLEGHGREELFPDVDLSRTVGWFTALYPVRLRLSESGDAGDLLESIREQLRAIPRGGIGFGLLRYLRNDQAAQQLRTRVQPKVSFNYFGQLDPAFAASSLFAPARETGLPEKALPSMRRHHIEINGSVLRGQFQFIWAYDAQKYERAAIEALAQDFVEALRALITHCLTRHVSRYTPSDFVEAQLSQRELDELVEQINNSLG